VFRLFHALFYFLFLHFFFFFFFLFFFLFFFFDMCPAFPVLNRIESRLSWSVENTRFPQSPIRSLKGCLFHFSMFSSAIGFSRCPEHFLPPYRASIYDVIVAVFFSLSLSRFLYSCVYSWLLVVPLLFLPKNFCRRRLKYLRFSII